MEDDADSRELLAELLEDDFDVTTAADGNRLSLTNRGALPLSGLRVVVEHDDGVRVLPVPTLPPGATVALDTGAHPHAAAS